VGPPELARTWSSTSCARTPPQVALPRGVLASRNDARTPWRAHGRDRQSSEKWEARNLAAYLLNAIARRWDERHRPLPVFLVESWYCACANGLPGSSSHPRWASAGLSCTPDHLRPRAGPIRASGDGGNQKISDAAHHRSGADRPGAIHPPRRRSRPARPLTTSNRPGAPGAIQEVLIELETGRPEPRRASALEAISAALAATLLGRCARLLGRGGHLFR